MIKKYISTVLITVLFSTCGECGYKPTALHYMNLFSIFRKDFRLTAPHIILKQSLRLKGSLSYSPLFTFIKELMHNEVWGYTEI